jgi:hypothetical protein
MPAMSTKSREVIFGSRLRGAKIRADGAREEAVMPQRRPRLDGSQMPSL